MTAPIWILGAHGGVGEALARTLHKRGNALFLTARDAGTIADLASETGAETASCDVLVDDQLDAAAEAVASEDGLAGLAYCVGSIVIKSLRQAQDQDFIDAFSLNALGAAKAIARTAPALRKAKGSVVLFSTVAVQQGFGNHAVIAAAKGAVEGLTRSLAAELAPHVRVNALAASLTDTPLAAPMLNNEQMAQSIAQMHPIPRLGTPEDLAEAAAFLLSQESSWITGQILNVDGGRGALRTKG